MSECLGLYIESNLIKYAKVSKEKDNLKIESFGIKTFDKIEDAIKQIVQETYSYKTPISVNLSNEMYNYFDVFTMLNKKDAERAIKTEFEYFCEERQYNKNLLDTKYFTVNNLKTDERLRAIHISVNKTEIAKKTQQLETYKLRNVSPLPVSIVNLADIKENENVAIINIEENTSITFVIKGQIYKIEILQEGMKEIFDKINVRENSYLKVYEICKNTTIYTAEGKYLQQEASEYLEEIMPTLYNIISKTKEFMIEDELDITKVFVTGSGALINNIDLYFQENLENIKCEILRPYFVNVENVRLNIKDYIEVNSAIAMGLQGVGEGLQGLNFKEVSFFDKLELPSFGSKNEKEKSGKKILPFSLPISFDLGGALDNVEKILLRTAGTIFMLIILYSIFSGVITKQIYDKLNQTNDVISSINSEIALADKDINSIRNKKTEYTTAINNLKTINEQATTKYRQRNAIPNLLNSLMSSIPTNVQLTSVSNTAGTHIVIKAQSERYEPLGIFKAQIISDQILIDVKSDASTKQDGVVKVTIEGELP